MLLKCHAPNISRNRHDSFHPFKFVQFDEASCLEFQSFDRCVDTFFSELEEHKLNMRALRQEQSALKKLETVKANLGSRVEELKVLGIKGNLDSDAIANRKLKLSMSGRQN